MHYRVTCATCGGSLIYTTGRGWEHIGQHEAEPEFELLWTQTTEKVGNNNG